MLETPPHTETDRADRDTPAMQGRQLFAYYGLLFLFLALWNLFTYDVIIHKEQQQQRRISIKVHRV